MEEKEVLAKWKEYCKELHEERESFINFYWALEREPSPLKLEITILEFFCS